MSLFKQSLYCSCAAVMLVMGAFVNPLSAMESPNEQIIIIQKNAPKVTLNPEDLYEWNILEVKTSQEILTLAVQGAMAKRKGDLETAIPMLEQAALYENVGALIDLAYICEGQEKLIQATKWYVLAFQIEWLKAGTYHLKAKEWLEGLPERYSSIKDCLDNLEQEKFQLFCKIITQGDFFSHYFLQESTQSTKSPNKIEKNTQFMERPNKNNKSALGAKRLALGIKVEEKEMASLESKILNLDRQNDLIKRPGLLMRIYDEHKSHEPYLSSEEINLKSLWASKKFKDFGMPSNEEKEKNGIDEFNDRQFKHAVYFLHTLNTPLALEKLGIIYEIGQPDTPQDYPKAADYYRRSKTSFSYQRLVTLYKEGHLGKIDYQEVVNIHELSEDTDYLKIQII